MVAPSDSPESPRMTVTEPLVKLRRATPCSAASSGSSCADGGCPGPCGNDRDHGNRAMAARAVGKMSRFMALMIRLLVGKRGTKQSPFHCRYLLAERVERSG